MQINDRDTGEQNSHTHKQPVERVGGPRFQKGRVTKVCPRQQGNKSQSQTKSSGKTMQGSGLENTRDQTESRGKHLSPGTKEQGHHTKSHKLNWNRKAGTRNRIENRARAVRTRLKWY